MFIRLSHDGIALSCWSQRFDCNTASLHQVMRSIVYMSFVVAWWFPAIGAQITPTQIADLLNFVLRSTFFEYNGSIYKQKDGAAMGSPVSAVIANLHMEEFEEQAIATAAYKPKIWKR